MRNNNHSNEKAGYSLVEIASVSKHENFESLKRYIEKPMIKDHENFSTDLFKYTGVSSDSDMDDFETPPPPPPKKQKPHKNSSAQSKPKSKKSKSQPAATKNQSQLVPVHAKVSDDDLTNSEISSVRNENTSNVMQMYKQNPTGMFMGAQLSNCTININMPE